MSNFLSFEGNYANSEGNVKAKLFLIHFVDENGVHIIYSPHLDLSGYGNTKEEAKTAFEDAFKDFMDYTLKKKTLGKLLDKLGWKIKGSMKKPRKFVTPKLEDLLDKSYVSDIFNKYKTETYHEEVAIHQL